MKYIVFIFAALTVYNASAQIKFQTLSQVVTDTSRGFSGTKWAVIEIENVMSLTGSGGMVVEFDNKSKVNLFQLFHGDSNVARSQNAYIMAALEYMDSKGFTLMSTYVANENTYNRFIFKRK